MVVQVKTHRLRKGVKQDTLAKAIGIGRSTISNIESSASAPSVLIALKMARYFKCRVEDLFVLTTTD